MIGKIDEFREGEEKWNDYSIRFSNWVTLNDLDAKKQVRALLAVSGDRTFETLKVLWKGEDPCECDLHTINEVLSAHYSPKPLKLSERFKFWSAIQQVGETLNSYLLRIQKLAEYCEFNEFLDQGLCDKFIFGLLDDGNNIRPSLISETNLSFKRAVEMASRICLSTGEAERIGPQEPEICKVMQKEFRVKSGKICYSCWESGQIRTKCSKRGKL